LQRKKGDEDSDQHLHLFHVREEGGKKKGPATSNASTKKERGGKTNSDEKKRGEENYVAVRASRLPLYNLREEVRRGGSYFNSICT